MENRHQAVLTVLPRTKGGPDYLVGDRSRNRVFRDCNSFLVPTETVALPGNIFGGVYVPGKYGKRVGFSRMLLQRGNVFIFKNVRFQTKSSFYFIFHLQRGKKNKNKKNNNNSMK